MFSLLIKVIPPLIKKAILYFQMTSLVEKFFLTLCLGLTVLCVFTERLVCHPKKNVFQWHGMVCQVFFRLGILSQRRKCKTIADIVCIFKIVIIQNLLLITGCHECEVESIRNYYKYCYIACEFHTRLSKDF